MTDRVAIGRPPVVILRDVFPELMRARIRTGLRQGALGPALMQRLSDRLTDLATTPLYAAFLFRPRRVACWSGSKSMLVHPIGRDGSRWLRCGVHVGEDVMLAFRFPGFTSPTIRLLPGSAVLFSAALPCEIVASGAHRPSAITCLIEGE